MEYNDKNTFFSRLKKFFSSLFKKDKQSTQLLPEKSTVSKDEYIKSLQHDIYINELAEKLLYGEIGPTDVEDEYIDELMAYFKSDIQTTKIKIEQCKRAHSEDASRNELKMTTY